MSVSWILIICSTDASSSLSHNNVPICQNILQLHFFHKNNINVLAKFKWMHLFVYQTPSKHSTAALLSCNASTCVLKW